ncbi:MAG: hypothetical protein AUH85_02435 [Chloroflexi bacterium 13_1_40CM_4_68_4]|nr:MAG: hypothetical protein AUH85_02435 [Chloroflexi bacterium 13_1_40CM_4_68_4]
MKKSRGHSKGTTRTSPRDEVSTGPLTMRSGTAADGGETAGGVVAVTATSCGRNRTFEAPPATTATPTSTAITAPAISIGSNRGSRESSRSRSVIR